MTWQAQVALALLIVSFPAAAQRRPRNASSSRRSASRQLSLKQIEQLLKLRTPDVVVSGEISSRGVSDAITEETIGRMKQAGAGPLAIAALEKLLPRATLRLTTEPGAEIFVDGAAAGRANAEGVLLLDGLEPGKHELAVRKPDFHDASLSVDLSSTRTTEVKAALTPTIGYLTLAADIPSFRVSLDGKPVPEGRLDAIPVAAGEHTVVFDAPLHKRMVKKALVEGGSKSVVSVKLELDTAAVQSLENSIVASYEGKHYQAVLREAGPYLDAVPEPSKNVLRAVTIANFKTGDIAKFKQYAGRLFERGGELEFPMTHNHSGWARSSHHDATLVVSGSTIEYIPLGPCKVPRFTVPISLVQVESRQVEEGVSEVSISMADPENASKQLVLDLDTASDTVARSVADLATKAAAGAYLDRPASNGLPPLPDVDTPFAVVNGNLLVLESVEAKEHRTKTASIYSIAVGTSAVKVRAPKPSFALRFDKLSPTGLELFRVESSRAQRSLNVGVASPIRMSALQMKNGVILYRAEQALSPGEYCLVPQDANHFYCFHAE